MPVYLIMLCIAIIGVQFLAYDGWTFHWYITALWITYFYFVLGRYLSKNEISKRLKRIFIALSVVSFVFTYKFTNLYSKKIGVGDTRWLGIECILL